MASIISSITSLVTASVSWLTTATGTVIQVIVTMGSIFPSWLVAIVLGVIALLVIFIIVKIVGFILDAIPFI